MVGGGVCIVVAEYNTADSRRVWPDPRPDVTRQLEQVLILHFSTERKAVTVPCLSLTLMYC